MKKNLRNAMIMLLGMVLLGACSLDNRIIDKPVFLARNTTSIEVSKVTLTDSTTVLDIFARYRPKWWIKIGPNSFLTDDKGQIYPIQKGVGIELGKEFWMPESGEAEFQLIFPRLSNEARFFDFSEDPEVDGGFKIWGVQLKGNELPELKLPKEIQVQKVDKEAKLEVPELKYGEATVKGRILDYQLGMPAVVKIVALNPLEGKDGGMDIKIAPDGTFTHTMNVLGTMKAVVSYDEMGVDAEIFVAPGQVSEIYLNIREGVRKRSKFHAEKTSSDRLYYYRGPLENVVRELPEANQLMMQNLKKSDTYDFGKKPEVLLEEYKQNWLAKVEKAKEVLSQSLLGQAVKTYMERELDFQLLVGLRQAPNILTNEYVESQPGVDRKMYGDFYTRLSRVHPSNYIDRELYAVMNDPMALLNAPYGVVILESALTGRMNGFTEGLYADLAKASKLYRCINNDFVPLSDEQKTSLETLPEACRLFLNAANDKLLAKIEANKKKAEFRINEVGKVANEDLFASLISKFRGKVLLVDFWATWCGPCRMANKEMIPMKEELKDKDVVYVYITGESSPEGTWKNMIPDIHGEHFRVTDAQWNYLCGAMGVEGVPSYFVIDREGSIRYKSVGFPGVSKIKDELKKELNK